MALPVATFHLLRAQVGDTPDDLLAGMETPLCGAEPTWDSAPAVQEQAVLVRMIDILTAYWRDALARVLTEDERKTIQLRLDSLHQQRTAAVSAQATAHQALAVRGGMAVGRLTTTAPITSPTNAPDANSSYWRGDPNRRRSW